LGEELDTHTVCGYGLQVSHLHVVSFVTSQTVSHLICMNVGAWRDVVVKSDGPGIDSWWCHWIFQWHIPSDHTMALGSTQPLVKMSTRNISWGIRRPVR